MSLKKLRHTCTFYTMLQHLVGKITRTSCLCRCMSKYYRAVGHAVPSRLSTVAQHFRFYLYIYIFFTIQQKMKKVFNY